MFARPPTPNPLENSFSQTARVGDFAVFSMGNDIDAARIVNITKTGYTVRRVRDEEDTDNPPKESEDGYRLEWHVRADKTFIIPKELESHFPILNRTWFVNRRLKGRAT